MFDEQAQFEIWAIRFYMHDTHNILQFEYKLLVIGPINSHGVLLLI